MNGDGVSWTKEKRLVPPPRPRPPRHISPLSSLHKEQPFRLQSALKTFLANPAPRIPVGCSPLEDSTPSRPGPVLQQERCRGGNLLQNISQDPRGSKSGKGAGESPEKHSTSSRTSP
ncbi:unnamed protein product [Lepidochelys kempii]